MTRSASVWYKGVRVGKGSDLYKALEENKPTVAAGLHAVAMAEFKQRYPECTDEWFLRVNSSVDTSTA